MTFKLIFEMSNLSYIFFHGTIHPKELHEAHVEEFLTHLAVVDQVAASTQNQALCALKKHHLAFMLMHGFGLKIGETLNLRIHNIDINNGILSLSKGRKLKLHAYLMPGLLKHLAQRRKQYHNDAKRGHCFIRHQQGHIVNDFQNQPLFYMPLPAR